MGPLIFCLVLGGATAAILEDPFDTRIVGGVTARPHEFPHQVSLQWNFNDGRSAKTHFCGGSIINHSWILTASHCKLSFSRNGYIEVVAGEHDLYAPDQTTQRRKAVKFTTHPAYNGGNRGFGPNDVAVIKVDRPFQYNSYVQPVYLPDKAYYNLGGEAYLSGWGSTSRSTNHSFPNALQKAKLPLVSVSTCKRLMSQTLVTNTNICAGALDGTRGACIADSGGPLVQYSNNRPVQVGVVSWGFIPCGGRNAPTVFAGVSYYLDWIKSAIKS